MALVQHFAALKPAPAPVCSVCIANYNGIKVLGICIESVLAQQHDEQVEIIVHDDASTDGSVEWIRQRYPNVELLAANENSGFCVANNRMAAHARGSYILLLNNDATLYPDALKTLLETIRNMPQPGILSLPQYDWRSGTLVDRGCQLDPFYNPVPNLDPARRDVAYVIGACLFLPRALWNDLGGFPEWMGSIGEDMYLCCLARLRGLPVRVAPNSGYRHRQGASFGGNRVDTGRLNTTYRRRTLSERNKTSVLLICTPTWLVWPLLAMHCTLMLMEGGVLSLLYRDSRVWREIYVPPLSYLVRNWSTMRARRLKIQATRRTTIRAYLRGFVVFSRKLTLLWRYGLPRLR